MQWPIPMSRYPQHISTLWQQGRDRYSSVGFWHIPISPLFSTSPKAFHERSPTSHTATRGVSVNHLFSSHTLRLRCLQVSRTCWSTGNALVTRVDIHMPSASILQSINRGDDWRRVIMLDSARILDSSIGNASYWRFEND